MGSIARLFADTIGIPDRQRGLVPVLSSASQH
jgi:hypothetical protein